MKKKTNSKNKELVEKIKEFTEFLNENEFDFFFFINQRKDKGVKGHEINIVDPANFIQGLQESRLQYENLDQALKTIAKFAPEIKKPKFIT